MIYRVQIDYRSHQYALVEADSPEQAGTLARRNTDALCAWDDSDPYGGDCDIGEVIEVKETVDPDHEHDTDGDPYCVGCASLIVRESHPEAADVIFRVQLEAGQ